MDTWSWLDIAKGFHQTSVYVKIGKNVWLHEA